MAIIVLSGSTKFKEEYMKCAEEQTLIGNIVLMCPIFHHADKLDIKPEVSKALDELHKKRMDMADAMLVICPNGYIGESTRKEIEYASFIKLRTYFWTGDK